MYNSAVVTRKIPFSLARQHFTAVIDEVEKSGMPITILRRGKPTAVIIDNDTYEAFLGQNQKKQWKLKGSILLKDGVDLDKALQKAKQERIRMWKLRRGKLAKELGDA